jgi:hypothetical protein
MGNNAPARKQWEHLGLTNDEALTSSVFVGNSTKSVMAILHYIVGL